MITGRMNRRITLQKRVTSKDENKGSSKIDFITVAHRVPARAVPVRGDELLKNGGVETHFDCTFWVRNARNLNEKDRILWDGKAYDVINVFPTNNNDGFEIPAKVVPRDQL